MRVVHGAAADGAGIANIDKGARAAWVAYTKIGVLVSIYENPSEIALEKSRKIGTSACRF